MPMNSPIRRAREQALDGALRLHRGTHTDLHLEPGVDREDTTTETRAAVLHTADLFAAWLLGTTTIRLTAGPVLSQQTGQPTGTTPEGNTMQIHDDERFTYTVDTEDAKGFDTADRIEWSVDNPDVVTLAPGENGRTCDVIAGVPGSAVITVIDLDTDPQLSATAAVDVLPGGTATIELAAGEVTKQ